MQVQEPNFVRNLVDEIKDIHDKAKALEYYAAEAKTSVFCRGCASATTSACNRNRIVLD